MKSLLLILAITLGISSGSFADQTTQNIPPEVAALLLSPQYAETIAAQVKIATDSGHTLTLSGFQVVTFGQDTYAYINLSERISASPGSPWAPCGVIVGQVEFGPQGEISVDSAYFQPIPVGTGGGSVGNSEQ